MKSHKKMILGILVLLVLLMTGILIGIFIKDGSGNRKIETLADWSENKIFDTVPIFKGDGIFINEAEDYGDGNWVIGIDGSNLNYYREYLQMLTAKGYEKIVDNGEQGLVDSVYTATYAKNDLYLTLTHIIAMEKTYISACYDRTISEHLFYNPEYLQGVSEDAKTTMYMLELYDMGNSFVYKLKNGHFLIEDGGKEADAPYLLDFLESLTPEGEKPIVEGWMITHAHIDHMGALKEIAKQKSYSDRILVDGIYYCAPNAEVLSREGSMAGNDEITRLAANMFMTQTGEKTKLYRPKTGERYYFCDVTIDIVHCQEQLPTEDYIGRWGWFNESSTVFMYTVDGQKILAGGDSDAGVMKKLMSIYDSEYMEVDVFTLLHHTLNTIDMFTDFCTVKTALFTTWSAIGRHKTVAQPAIRHLKDSVAEYYAWGKGTVALTFPYKVGEAEILPKFKWQYHGGKKGYTDTQFFPDRYDDNDLASWKE